jgi:hypothetical protein
VKVVFVRQSIKVTFKLIFRNLSSLSCLTHNLMFHIEGNLFQIEAFVTGFSFSNSGFLFDLLHEIQYILFFWGNQFHRVSFLLRYSFEVGLHASEVRGSFTTLLLLDFYRIIFTFSIVL